MPLWFLSCWTPHISSLIICEHLPVVVAIWWISLKYYTTCLIWTFASDGEYLQDLVSICIIKILWLSRVWLQVEQNNTRRGCLDISLKVKIVEDQWSCLVVSEIVMLWAVWVGWPWWWSGAVTAACWWSWVRHSLCLPWVDLNWSWLCWWFMLGSPCALGISSVNNIICFCKLTPVSILALEQWLC